MINEQLAEISNLALVVTIVLYVLALIGFAADLASTSQRRSDARLAALERQEASRSLQGASVGAGGAGTLPAGAGGTGASAAVPGVTGEDRPSSGTMTAQRFAFLLAGAATVLHALGVITHALATQRVPWRTCEFATSTAVVMLVPRVQHQAHRAAGAGHLRDRPGAAGLLLANLLDRAAAELTPSRRTRTGSTSTSAWP